ncbi:hypothetical protein [Intestinimonas butyriciproducens]|uniref:hypothetical protein n=1 Tax=Intestinimonas butyriciproducens TaxID=1297617 RepID=UPI001956F07E|nr:hypothetical protein [Intestinimonas butyriciproducens]MBM6919131.1 hypothetical protein [Intestinimonas butyriciproducens]
MSERYTRLFTLPGSLYAQGSPLIILAGALLKDNQTGRVLAQLKLKNVGTKSVKAVKVSVTPLDSAGMENGQPVEHPYLDLHAARDGEFGQKEPIPFPDPTTRAFRGAITQVVFTDGSLWGPAEGAWEVLSPSRPLESVLRDQELCKEYQIQYGANCRVFPREEAGLWQCACGAWNRQEEESCHACGKNLDQLKGFDLEQLKASRDARLAREQQAMAAQQAAASQAAPAAPSKGNRPQWLIPGIAALLVVLIGGGVFFVNRGKPASSGSSASGGGTQSAASDDSGSAAGGDDTQSAASGDSGNSGTATAASPVDTLCNFIREEGEIRDRVDFPAFPIYYEDCYVYEKTMDSGVKYFFLADEEDNDLLWFHAQWPVDSNMEVTLFYNWEEGFISFMPTVEVTSNSGSKTSYILRGSVDIADYHANMDVTPSSVEEAETGAEAPEYTQPLTKSCTSLMHFSILRLSELCEEVGISMDDLGFINFENPVID